MKKMMFVVLFLLTIIPIGTKAFQTSATSAILMDQDSGRILYANNIHLTRSVASISKMMTALLACESGKLDDMVTIDEEVLKAYGSGIYVKPGEEMRLRDLVYGLMLRSGNDASLAIAKYVSGSVSTFVTKMNEKALAIGMKETVFHNPNGLDEEKGNISSAYDMALLASYAMKNEDYRTIVGTEKYKVKTNMNTYIWYNKNKLLTMYEHTTGGKTGFTKIAKRTLASTASFDGLNLTVVTLNDGNDWQDHISLYKEAFAQYKNYTILPAGPITIENENYYKNHELYIKESLTIPLLDSEKDSISIKYELQKERNYKSGDIIGKVKLMIDDKVVNEKDIYIEKVVGKKKKASFWKTFVDWVKNLW